MVAVVKAITTSDTIEQAAEDAVLSAFNTSFHGLPEISKLTLDEERSAPRPAARVTEQICQLIGLTGMPDINALGYTTRLVGTADALTDFLKH